MTPDVTKVLRALAGVLGTQVLSEVKTPFTQQSVGFSATILLLLVQDYDRAAAVLAEENLAVRALLKQAAPMAGDELRALIAALDGLAPNADLRISALTRENGELRSMLVDVHALAEGLSGAGAAELDASIWQELRRSAARRHVDGVLG
jgi:hypothetical protein